MKSILFGIACIAVVQLNAQTMFENEAASNWQHLDKTIDGTVGLSTLKAQNELLKNKQSKTIVVAVLDSGIDIEHEDLQDNIWVNTDEIPNNGIDDDKNGYIDDVNGWSFISGKDEDVEFDSSEMTRVYGALHKKYAGVSEADVTDKDDYAYYQKMKTKFEKAKSRIEKELSQIKQFAGFMTMATGMLTEKLDGKEMTVENLKALELEGRDAKIRDAMSEIIVSGAVDEINEAQASMERQLLHGFDLSFDTRHIVGDNYEDINERYYGTNRVEGPDAGHGTHVAGIIGGVHGNGIGLDGIAHDVSIMTLRVVPDGDERDKDVGNAIRYAVDNGAKVINMSFGKSFSPYKEAVDQAVKYAEENGVLLVHAAGNDGRLVTETNNFPNNLLDEETISNNWISVGASSWNDDLVAPFSNYSRELVDVFAPGVDVYSTVPNNKYKANSGTSMASPVVAGLAALVWSYYPELTVIELRAIILDSSVNYGKSKVVKPGKNKKTRFKKLSTTGGVVNAYEALKLAEERTSK